MNLLEVDNLTVWYQENNFILKDLNIRIGKGLIVGLLGKNGQGKTTLLNTIVGIHTNFRGKITIHNYENGNDLIAKRERFFVPDHPVLFDEMSARSYIEFLHQIYKKKWNESKYDYYTQLFEFTQHGQQVIKTLSLGNKQKTVLIAAFMIRAPLLILDEPLVGLDVMSIEKFYIEIEKYVEEGNSVLFSTHLIEIIEKVCMQVAILNNKKIVKVLDLSQGLNVREEFNRVIEGD